MTLKEWLQQNHGEHCYFAFPIIEEVSATKEEKPKPFTVAEVWQIPVGILNKEIEVKG